MLNAHKGTIKHLIKNKDIPYNDKYFDWRKLKSNIIIRDNFTCQMCKTYFGHNLLALTAHHIVSRKNNGSDEPRNLITLCGRCHDIAEFNNFNYKQILNYHKKVNNKFKQKFPPKSTYLWEELKS